MPTVTSMGWHAPKPSEVDVIQTSENAISAACEKLPQVVASLKFAMRVPAQRSVIPSTDPLKLQKTRVAPEIPAQPPQVPLQVVWLAPAGPHTMTRPAFDSEL